MGDPERTQTPRPPVLRTVKPSTRGAPPSTRSTWALSTSRIVSAAPSVESSWTSRAPRSITSAQVPGPTSTVSPSEAAASAAWMDV